jgi:DNA-directed RNA polymerase specialized sigma24 family protein
MDPYGADEPTVELVRPFLDRKRPESRASVEEDHSAAAHGVRAYTMTGGRAHASGVLEFETMLQATGGGREALTALKFERAEILRLCQTDPLSVAELAAKMHVPIGVVRVVAADLASEGMLESFQPSANVADDVLLITRLIAGVRSL